MSTIFYLTFQCVLEKSKKPLNREQNSEQISPILFRVPHHCAGFTLGEDLGFLIMSDSIEKFFSLVEKTDTCWIWKGTKRPDGYGIFRPRKPVGYTVPSQFRAHRWIYEKMVGEIPNGLFCCHKCDNPSCVNPSHIFLGTAHDNMQDCLKKGRQVSGLKVRPDRAAKGDMNGTRKHPEKVLRGEKHPSAKINNEIARQIKLAILRGDTGIKIAERFSISKQLVSSIKIGKTWRHVTC